METTKCLYDQCMDNERISLNTFTVALFRAFQYADGTNKKKILDNWGEGFTNSKYL